MWETKRKIKQSALSFAVLFAMTMSLPVSAAALELIPVGSAVGIEVDVDGAMVEELSEVNTSKGSVQPAKKAGIKKNG